MASPHVFEARCLRRKLSRGLVSQAAVRALFVVLLPPHRNLAPGVEQILKPAQVQTFFPQPSVEAFHSTVLCRLSRLDVQQLDLPLDAPGQKVPARQLRPVVAANRLRHAPLSYDLFQHSRHSPAGKARVHLQRQTLSRIRVHHAKHPDRSSTRHRIVHEIQGPFLIRCCPCHQRLSLPHAMLPLLPPNPQSCLAIDPMQALVVHSLSASPQQHMQPSIPEARFLPR